MFNWDNDLPELYRKRKGRGGLVLIPDVTANREVQWRDQDDVDKPYFTSEQIAQEAVEHFLALIQATSEEAS